MKIIVLSLFVIAACLAISVYIATLFQMLFGARYDDLLIVRIGNIVLPKK